MVPLANIMLSETVFGGVGAGLYGMLVYVVLAVFIAGLDGRPHAGISGQEDRSLRREDGHAAVLVFPLIILVLPASPRSPKFGHRSISNAGPHGLSQILYAFTSMAG